MTEDLKSANERFLESLQREKDGVPVGLSVARGKKALPVAGAPKFDLSIGENENGIGIGLLYEKLMVGRLLIQGVSGAGKSWTLRRILEQSKGGMQQIVFDPEGELRTISDFCGLAIIDASKLDPAGIASAADRVREHRISVLVDLSDVDRERQMILVATALERLVAARREHWHPAIVAVDEAHLFAPFGGQGAESVAVRKRAISAVTDLMARGRKRGLCGVLATQRIARLAKSVASEVHNFLIGLNTLDLDIRRAAETIGWDARKAFDRLPVLSPGDFVAVGPAFSLSPCVLRVGTVETEHGGEPAVVPAPTDLDPSKAAELLDLQALEEASAADEAERAEHALPPGLKAVRSFVRDPAFPLSGVIWRELVSLAPDGAAVGQMPAAFKVDGGDVAAAIDLLDRYGALEFSDDSDDRHVRVAKGMLP